MLPTGEGPEAELGPLPAHTGGFPCLDTGICGVKIWSQAQHLRDCTGSKGPCCCRNSRVRRVPCAGLRVGQPVAELAYGAFSEWAVVPAKYALPVPVVAPEIVALLTSGLTASIGVLLMLSCTVRDVALHGVLS